MKPTLSFLHHTLRALCAIFAFTLLIGSSVSAQTFKLLGAFNGTNGSQPVGNLIADSSGNLYGVTIAGGLQNKSQCYFYSGCGTVFKLGKTAAGGRKLSVLYEFTGGSDGGNPAAGLAMDSGGNLYGTALYGGINFGVVFELSPTSSGPWKETPIYTFQAGADAENPQSQLAFDASGNLYGTTINGGTGYCSEFSSCGTVFELSKSSSGSWSETVIYDFADNADGFLASGPLVIDRHGNIFGSTTTGGTLNGYCGYGLYGCGTIFELSPNSSGGWTKNTVWVFGSNPYQQYQYDGAVPDGGVIVDAAGNLYGTAASGGNPNCGGSIPGCGVVFALHSSSSGAWTQKVLLDFSPLARGADPRGTLTFDAGGNLYGTTTINGLLGGNKTGSGVVFKLTRNSSGSWRQTILHVFSGTDGAAPTSNLVVDAAGNLFGTTSAGGPGYGGVVFEITP